MLRKGKVYSIGTAAEVCDRYLETDTAKLDSGQFNEAGQVITKTNETSVENHVLSNLQPINPSYRWGEGGVAISAWSLSDASGKLTTSFHFGEEMVLSVLLNATENIDHCFPGFMLRDRNGYHLTGITNRTCGKDITGIFRGESILLEFKIKLLYRADNYSILLNIAKDEYGTGFYDLCENVGNFTILAENAECPPWGYGRTYLPTTLDVTLIKK
jgi:hypothetical protein